MALIPVIEELLKLEMIVLLVLALVYVHLGLLKRFDHVLIGFVNVFVILGPLKMVFLVKITVFHIIMSKVFEFIILIMDYII